MELNLSFNIRFLLYKMCDLEYRVIDMEVPL